ncbi:PAS domain-containing protein (plasmid) [Hymenobacter sp. BRD128]|uniref:PAS domain-containing protein n=1 Tax=Hymenobacter sp. BRD128 TaxID=2675878 RepID=UPI0015639642|nr:PAS domain-containing protein [Hymenobacter sp. BRD128]QKG59180.1 PAS domain-containing protein [Hymenobacter sp. BRD128]
MSLAALPVQFQRLFRALPDNYLLLAADGTVLDNSDAHVAVSMRPRAEAVGRDVFAAFPALDAAPQAQLAASLAHVRAHREPHTIALRYDLEQPTEQGGGFVVRYCEATHFPVLDDDGQLLYILQQTHDVTEQKLASERQATLQRERDEAQQYVQFVLDTMPVLVATTRPDGQAEYFNPRWLEFTGRPLEELVSGRWTELVHPDDLPRLARQRDLSVHERRETQYDFRLRRHDGHYRWMLGRTMPRLDAEGRVQLRVGVCLDIHEQKELVRELLEAGEQQGVLAEQAYQAHQQVQSQRETFYSLFTQAPAVIAISKGSDHVFEFVNPRFQEFFPGQELVGHRTAEVVPEAEAQGFLALLDRVYQTGEPFTGHEMPIEFQRPGQAPDPRYFNFTYQAFRENGQIVGVSTFAYDVTDLVRARQAFEARPSAASA